MKKEKLEKLAEQVFEEEIQQLNRDNRCFLPYRTVLGFRDKRLDQHLKILMSKYNCPQASKSNTWKWWDDVREMCIIGVLELLKKKGSIPEDINAFYIAMNVACKELTKDSKNVEFADYLTRSSVSNRGFEGNRFDEQQSRIWNSGDEQETEAYKRLKKIKFNKIMKSSPEQKKLLHEYALDRTNAIKQREIAKIFNCSEANISQQLKKIRHKIDKYYPVKKLKGLHPAPFSLMIEKAIRTYKKYIKEFDEQTNYIELIKKLVIHDFQYDHYSKISGEKLVANQDIKVNIDLGDFNKEVDEYLNDDCLDKDYYTYWNLKSFNLLKSLIEEFIKYDNKVKKFYKEQNKKAQNNVDYLKNEKCPELLVHNDLQGVKRAKIG